MGTFHHVAAAGIGLVLLLLAPAWRQSTVAAQLSAACRTVDYDLAGRLGH
jgi:hypothetical protein